MLSRAVTNLESARLCLAELTALARQQGLSLRAPPPEPTTCCGRGCNGCVWEGYFAAVAYWREEALEQLRAAQQAFAPGRVFRG